MSFRNHDLLCQDFLPPLILLNQLQVLIDQCHPIFDVDILISSRVDAIKTLSLGILLVD